MKKNILTKRLVSAICSAAMLVSCVPAFTAAAAENDETLYVLSGNNFTDADKALYSGKTLVIPDTGAEYTWTSDSDTNFKTGDKYDSANAVSGLLPTNRQMVGGTIQSDDGRRVLWTNWNSDSFNTAQFDLKGVYDINAVDVWSLAKKNKDTTGPLYYLIGDIEIYAGTEKNNMRKVWSGNAADPIKADLDAYFGSGTDVNKYEQTSAKFDAVKARYVNISVKRQPNYTMTVSDGTKTTVRVPNGIAAEMVIFGTLANGADEVTVRKVQARAAEYLAMRDYYTADSVETLETALTNLNEADAEIAAVFVQEVEAAIENLMPGKTHYTLSGNKWSDASKAAYTSWGETLASDLPGNTTSHTWDSKSAPWEGTDKLTTGDFVDTNISLFSKWNEVNPHLAYYDLGGNYVVDRVDVIQHMNVSNGVIQGSQRMGSVYIWLSDDGVNYTKAAVELGNDSNPVYNEIGEHSFTKTTVTFAPKKARYVAVQTAKRSDKNQYTLAQTAIFGYETKTIGLERSIANAQKYLDFKALYTGETAQALQTAVTDAKTLTDDSAETDITSAQTAIAAAIDTLVPVNGRRIFSGNSLSTEDKNVYNSDSSVSTDPVQNEPTYEILSDAEAIKVHGTDPTRLKNGKLLSPNEYLCTQWNTANELIVSWDLGKDAVVDRVDMFLPKAPDTAAGTVTVSVSHDGETYTEVGYKTLSSEGEDYTVLVHWASGDQYEWLTSVKFAPEKARYVKAVLTRSSASGIYKTAINEMIIFGISADTGALEAEVNKYSNEKLEELRSILTEESYNGLTAAIATANTVIGDASKTQTEIDAELAKLKAAFENFEYTSTAGVLTCNLKNDTDKSLYTGYDNLYTGLSYTIVGNADNAEGNTNLTDGNITDPRVGKDGELVWGKYYDNSPKEEISVIVDAGQEVYFTGADLYEVMYNPVQGIGDLSISVSTDGTEYTEVWSETSGKTVQAGDRVINKLGGDFAPQKGRYLKFTSMPRMYQQILAEIVVKGFKAADAADILPAAFADTTYTIFDTDMMTTENIAGADMIMANGNVINESETALAGYVFTAVYRDGRLISAAKSSKIELSANGEAKWSTVLENLGGLPENARLVNYFWSDMEPIAEKQEK